MKKFKKSYFLKNLTIIRKLRSKRIVSSWLTLSLSANEMKIMKRFPKLNHFFFKIERVFMFYKEIFRKSELN